MCLPHGWDGGHVSKQYVHSWIFMNMYHTYDCVWESGGGCICVSRLMFIYMCVCLCACLLVCLPVPSFEDVCVRVSISTLYTHVHKPHRKRETKTHKASAGSPLSTLHNHTGSAHNHTCVLSHPCGPNFAASTRHCELPLDTTPLAAVAAAVRPVTAVAAVGWCPGS